MSPSPLMGTLGTVYFGYLLVSSPRCLGMVPLGLDGYLENWGALISRNIYIYIYVSSCIYHSRQACDINLLLSQDKTSRRKVENCLGFVFVTMILPYWHPLCSCLVEDEERGERRINSASFSITHMRVCEVGCKCVEPFTVPDSRVFEIDKSWYGIIISEFCVYLSFQRCLSWNKWVRASYGFFKSDLL